MRCFPGPAVSGQVSLRVQAAILLVALVLAVPSGAGAQVFETVGTRALGMGGAFTAVADDASAAYWNPAGLATGGPYSVVWDWSSAETVGPGASPGAGRRRAGYFALTTYPFGLSHYRLSHDVVQPVSPAEVLSPDREDRGPNVWALSSLATQHTGITLLQSLADGLVVGATLKRVRGTAGLTERTSDGSLESLLDEADRLDGLTGSRMDVDLGIMAGVEQVRLGVVVRNLREPDFEAPGGGRLTLERQARVGLAVMPARTLTVAVDVDLTRLESAAGARRMLAAGAEHWPVRRLGLRGGFRRSVAGEARAVGSGGVSLAVRPGVWVEAQFSRGSQAADRSWGVAARLGY